MAENNPWENTTLFDATTPHDDHEDVPPLTGRPASPSSTIKHNPWRSRASSVRSHHRANTESVDSFDYAANELQELTGGGDDIWRNKFLARPPTYSEGSTIGEPISLILTPPANKVQTGSTSPPLNELACNLSILSAGFVCCSLL